MIFKKIYLLLIIGTTAGLFAQIPDLPDNTWALLRPTLHNGEVEARSYSGICYDSDRGSIYYFGGAHGSYLGNDVDEFNVADNNWREHYPAEFVNSCCNAGLCGTCSGGGDDGISPTGKPATAHTYTAYTYSSKEKAFVYFARSSGTWLYYPATTRWVKRNRAPVRESDPLGRSAVYVPEKDLVYVKFVNGEFYTYNINTDAWTRKTPYPDWTSDAVILYVKKENAIYLVRQRIAKYSIEKDTWTDLGPTLAGKAIPGAAYDSHNNVILQIVGYDDNSPVYSMLHKFDITTGQWERIKPISLPPFNNTRYYEFTFDPINNVFILLRPVVNYSRPGDYFSHDDMNTYIYRYKNISLDSESDNRRLYQNLKWSIRPNPFKTASTISVLLEQKQRISLEM
jgi:hypothetical protein